jgi:hypothetical protein
VLTEGLSLTRTLVHHVIALLEMRELDRVRIAMADSLRGSRLTCPDRYAALVQVLAMERSVPGVLDDAFTPALLRAEAEHLWELHQTGVVRQMFFRADRHEAVLLLEVADGAAAKGALDQLPLVRSGLIDFEIVPLRAYPGFARLFGS